MPAVVNALEKANLKDNTDILFLLGDFNVDFTDKKLPSYKDLNLVTRMWGLNQQITSPTRYYVREGVLLNTTIDLIFTNSDFITFAGTLDLNICDHSAVLVTRKKLSEKRKKVEFTGRSYRNYDKAAFQNTLTNEDWAPLFESTNPDEQWDIMLNIILNNINQMSPLRSCKVDEVKEAWITNEALEAIRDKDRALRLAKRSGRVEDWEEAKRLRNKVGRDLENLRADFLKKQQEVNSDDPKKFWRAVSSIIPKNKAKSGTIWSRDADEGNKVPSPQTAAFINTFFTNIGPELAREHKTDWSYFGETVGATMGRVTTSAEEVRRLVKDINIMKSSGLDDLSSRVCKDALHH